MKNSKNLDYLKLMTQSKIATEIHSFLRKRTNGQKYVKKCSPSVATREMQIKNTLRYQFTPERMASMRKSNSNKCW